MRARLPYFIAIVQSILFLVHIAVYLNWTFFWGSMEPSELLALRVVMSFLSISFVTASLLAYRYSNFLVRIFYTLSAVWLGFVTFFFLAALGSSLTYVLLVVLPVGKPGPRTLLIVFFGLAFLTGVYGLVNASWTRVRRVTIRLPNLPESWHGRTAALVSDLHLGHVRNRAFLRRIVRMLTRLRPDVLFIAGDLFDGTAVELGQLSQPWLNFSAPLGSYFIAGNHEQYSSLTKYFDTVRKSGIQILDNEKIVLDGLQIVGVSYWESVNVEKFRAVLKKVGLDRRTASILLVHTPDHLPLAAEAGISLQLSGHTHRGQFFPFTLAVKRMYGKYAYGLNRFEALTVYTSCGAGTWGPPFRVGSNPEIVLIRFE